MTHLEVHNPDEGLRKSSAHCVIARCQVISGLHGRNPQTCHERLPDLSAEAQIPQASAYVGAQTRCAPSFPSRHRGLLARSCLQLIETVAKAGTCISIGQQASD